MLWLGLPILAGCATVPANIDHACILLDGRDDWYDSLRASEKKWGVPTHVQLAIIHQESKFRSDAKPSRIKWLGFIPGPRPSSAYGYAQALDDTWAWYKAKSGNSWADRDNFEDAVDFIGWYVDVTYKTLGLSKSDAKSQYLAYHEGHGGYKKKTFLKKPWLMQVADKVAERAANYKKQLRLCDNHQNKRSTLSLF
ncbi:MAG TPA: transglycosylase SLT domain-containing protein [Magnetococcales bacterium]|nr:transglycosylase SLT domain-containing protein [Magnetococcales bacterium]